MTRAFAPIVLAINLCASVFVAGCASPGDPSARHPVVPTSVADLAARQSGGEIVLTFSVPARSTDREALAERPSIEIFRAEIPSGVAADKKSPWRLVYTIPPERVDIYLADNRISFRDPLAPANLGRAGGAPIAYMVRTRAARARASDNSNIFTVHVFPPPAPPVGVSTEVMESAIALRWNESVPPAGAALAGYRIYRARMESGMEDIPPNIPQAKLKSPQELAGSASSPEFRDLHFEFGATYLYTVRSVASFGADSVESADSAPVMVTPRDIFPPAAPRALELAVMPATPQGPAYIELSWEISSEPDLAGYRVYRSDLEESSGQRLNEELLPSPAFRDISVVDGKRYFYRVSAVDRAGNESSMSSAVPADVPKEVP